MKPFRLCAALLLVVGPGSGCDSDPVGKSASALPSAAQPDNRETASRDITALGARQTPPPALQLRLTEESIAEMADAAASADFETANRKPQFFGKQATHDPDKAISIKVSPGIRPGEDMGDLPSLDGGSIEFKMNTD